MELNERETLIKVEQQLKNSIENQAQIVEDMREIFSRIDSGSKVIAGVKGDLQTHLETSLVQRENCLSRIANNKCIFEDLERRYEENKREIRTALEKEETARENLENDYRNFKDMLKTSIRNFKLMMATIVGIATIITPYITLVLKEILDK